MLDFHWAEALRRAQVLVRSKDLLHGKNMHTLIALKIWSCLKERLIIFDRGGPAQTAGLRVDGNRFFPLISPPRKPRGNGPDILPRTLKKGPELGTRLSYCTSLSLPERIGLHACSWCSSGGILLRRGQPAQGIRRTRGFSTWKSRPFLTFQHRFWMEESNLSTSSAAK